jgi:thiamine biosynthesis lipoprotein
MVFCIHNVERDSALKAILLFLVAFVCQVSFAGDLQRFEYSQMAMGVRARIVLYADSQLTAEEACRAAFERISLLEGIMSDYQADSELMKLCANAGGSPVKVSKELLFVLVKSKYLSRISDGSFDVTIGPLVKLWRRARKTGVLPTEDEMAKVRKLVDWRKIIINGMAGTVQLELPGMLLDLGGIGKGYACDEAMAVLKKHGIKSALVELGGDIVVSGPPPGKTGWEIEIANAPNFCTKKFFLAYRAISSSGDTEQFVEIQGRRYSHIVDPKSGLGLTNRTAVTVIGPSGTLCDGLSTALSVMGEDKAVALLKRFPKVQAYIRKLE